MAGLPLRCVDTVEKLELPTNKYRSYEHSDVQPADLMPVARLSLAVSGVSPVTEN
jgi:hypothetical protein